MKKINQYRKFLKIFQYVGMILILLVGFVLIYFMGRNDSSNAMWTMILALGVILLLFVFMIFVLTPLSDRLLKMIINESLSGMVQNVCYSKKKGFTKETFAKFRFVKDMGNTYACTDYYQFQYKEESIESCTISVSNQFKVKRKKYADQYFLGRVYVISNPLSDRFLILGKNKPNESRKKEMEAEGYIEIPMKVKKYAERFEVFYQGEKPTCNMQEIIEKLYFLQMQGKCPVSCLFRKNTIVLALNSHRYYAEVELKKEIDMDLVKEYRRDVQIVLNFIDSLKTVDR